MTGGAFEVEKLAADLGRCSAKIVTSMRNTYAQAGDAFAQEWASNARATSGTHGKWYPDSIDSELRFSFGVEVEVGPNSAKKQGKMGRGFEFGSQNQPPHLDGQRAIPSAQARLEVMADATIGHLLP